MKMVLCKLKVDTVISIQSDRNCQNKRFQKVCFRKLEQTFFSPSENEGEQILCSPEGSHFPAENKEDYMLQIKNLSIIHKKDLCVILNDFSCVLNDGDKAVIIGEEGNGKSTLLKWIYDEKLVDDYCETEGELVKTKERIAYLPQELPKEKRTLSVCEFFMEEESFLEQTPKTLGQSERYDLSEAYQLFRKQEIIGNYTA